MGVVSRPSQLRLGWILAPPLSHATVAIATRCGMLTEYVSTLLLGTILSLCLSVFHGHFARLLHETYPFRSVTQTGDQVTAAGRYAR